MTTRSFYEYQVNNLITFSVKRKGFLFIPDIFIQPSDFWRSKPVPVNKPLGLLPGPAVRRNREKFDRGDKLFYLKFDFTFVSLTPKTVARNGL